ncbi:MAG: hypothetical protein Q4B23_05190 [Helcococcus sp.]|nr:hypothetical protein [Helcococcus sp.]
MRIYIKENGKTRLNLRIPSAFLTSPTIWRIYFYIMNEGLKNSFNGLEENEDKVEYDENVEKQIIKNDNIGQIKVGKESAKVIGNSFKRLKKKYGKFILVEIIDEDTEVLITL